MPSVLETLYKPVDQAIRVAQGVSDVLEPYLILHEFGKTGVYPAELSAEILFWQYPSPGGHLYFLDVIELISKEVYEIETTGNIKDSVLEHLRTGSYDTKTGGFREWEGTRKFRVSPSTVSSTSNVVNLLRHFARVDDGQPLGYSNAVELLGQEMVEAAISFIKDSQDQNLGGFHHNPEMSATQQGRPSIWNTRRALDILWNLEQGDYGTQHAREFLWRCLVDNLLNAGIGFRESPAKYSSPNPSSGATVSALQVLKSFGEYGWIKERRQALINFLGSCWNIDKKGLGGFAYMPADKPFLLYTNQVLSCLDILGVDVEELLPDPDSRKRLIKFYEEACKSREKDRLLFGIAPGWTPNSYVMRDTVYTLKSLSEEHPDFAEFYQKIFGNTVKVVGGMYEFALTQEYARWLGLLEKWNSHSIP